MKTYRPKITQKRIVYTQEYCWRCSGLGYDGLGQTPLEAFKDWETLLHISIFRSAAIFWWINKQCIEFSKMWRGKL